MRVLIYALPRWIASAPTRCVTSTCPRVPERSPDRPPLLTCSVLYRAFPSVSSFARVTEMRGPTKFGKNGSPTSLNLHSLVNMKGGEYFLCAPYSVLETTEIGRHTRIGVKASVCCSPGRDRGQGPCIPADGPSPYQLVQIPGQPPRSLQVRPGSL